ncbi:hypothetical protein Hanom_Chr05g00399551 [Helianthus anomalus]
MDPYNPNNLNLNPDIFAVPGYYLSMEPSWSSSQFSVNAFAGFQQSPNAFSQMQQMQQMQSLQNMIKRNSFNMQVQSQQPQPVESSQSPQPVEDKIEIVPETQPQVAVDQNQSSKAKAKPWTRLEEEAQFKAYTEVMAQKAKVKVRVVEEKVRLNKEKNELKEWEIMTTDVENYSEEKRATLKKMQERIMKSGVVFRIFFRLCLFNLCNVWFFNINEFIFISYLINVKKVDEVKKINK